MKQDETVIKSVTIIEDSESGSGYALCILDEFDNEDIVPITDVVDDGKTLKLPDNPSGRKYWSIAKVEKGLMELTEKAPSAPRTTGVTTSRKWEEYLTDEERATYETIRQAATERMMAEKNDPRKKLEKQLAALQAKLASLNNQ